MICLIIIFFMSLVSIIIPYFRKKKYILETINSVINQSYKKFEIIIIYDDDKKTDLEFIKKISQKDKRIKLVINKKNYGAGISRNLGIKISKGDYISFIDSDDIWSKHKLKKQLNYMKKNKLNFTHTNYQIIDKNLKVISRRVARNFISLNDLIKSCDIGLSTVMLKKKLLNQNCFPSLRTKEDFVLWLNLLQKGVNIYGINDYLVTWRKVEGSLSTSLIQKFLDGFKVYYFYMKFNFFKSIYYLFCLSLNFLKKEIR